MAPAIASPRRNPHAQRFPPLDTSQLTFAHTAYAFQASTPSKLGLHENEIVAVIGKLDLSMEVDPRGGRDS